MVLQKSRSCSSFVKIFPLIFSGVLSSRFLQFPLPLFFSNFFLGYFNFEFFFFCRMVMYRIFRFMFIRRQGLCWMNLQQGLTFSMLDNLVIVFRLVQHSLQRLRFHFHVLFVVIVTFVNK